jgi:hypothetical protein
MRGRFGRKELSLDNALGDLRQIEAMAPWQFARLSFESPTRV